MKLSDADKDTSFHLSDIVFWIEKDLFVLCVSRELSAHRPHCKTKIRSLKKKKKKAERGKIFVCMEKALFYLYMHNFLQMSICCYCALLKINEPSVLSKGKVKKRDLRTSFILFSLDLHVYNCKSMRSKCLLHNVLTSLFSRRHSTLQVFFVPRFNTVEQITNSN